MSVSSYFKNIFKSPPEFNVTDDDIKTVITQDRVGFVFSDRLHRIYKVIRDKYEIEHREELRLFDSWENEFIKHIYCMAKVLTEGPKKVVIKKEECEAFEEIELSFSCKDYSQPFKCFAIELDPEWSKQKSIYKEKEAFPYGLTLCFYDQVLVYNFIVDNHMCSGVFYGERTLEDILRSVKENSPSFINTDGITRCLRVATNCCMYMMSNGFTENIESKKEKKKLKKLSEKSGLRPEKKLDRIAEANSFPLVYEINQTVTVRSCVGTIHEPSDNPKILKPHWRRSHWRQQRYGENLIKVKNVLIPHTMVNRKRFMGQMFNTEYTVKL
jgi:hypothetical protein